MGQEIQDPEGLETKSLPFHQRFLSSLSVALFFKCRSPRAVKIEDEFLLTEFVTLSCLRHHEILFDDSERDLPAGAWNSSNFSAYIGI